MLLRRPIYTMIIGVRLRDLSILWKKTESSACKERDPPNPETELTAEAQRGLRPQPACRQALQAQIEHALGRPVGGFGRVQLA